VTQKIAKAAARIKMGIDKNIRLGNINAKRDWDIQKITFIICESLYSLKRLKTLS